MIVPGYVAFEKVRMVDNTTNLHTIGLETHLACETQVDSPIISRCQGKAGEAGARPGQAGEDGKQPTLDLQPSMWIGISYIKI